MFPSVMDTRDANPSESPLAAPFLSVVIPAFNEEGRIVSTLEQVVSYLGAQPYSWEVLVVDDGSSDSTATLARRLAVEEERVRVETIPHGGKGWAVKQGMLAARGRYRFMCDADLAMPIERLEELLNGMAEGYDVVIASRQIAGARRFGESIWRHFMGRVFNWTVRLLAVRGFDDTQCGFKCFRGEVAEKLFRSQRTLGFGFDVEILHMAVKKGMRVQEIPIDWYHQRSSKVRPLVDSFLMLRDTILLRLRDMRREQD